VTSVKLDPVWSRSGRVSIRSGLDPVVSHTDYFPRDVFLRTVLKYYHPPLFHFEKQEMTRSLLTTCEVHKLADCKKFFDLLSVIRRNVIEKFDLCYLTPSSVDCKEFVHYAKNDVEDKSENQVDLYYM